MAAGDQFGFLDGDVLPVSAARVVADDPVAGFGGGEADGLEHEVIRGPACADGVQGNDAGCLDVGIVDVPLIRDLFRVADRFFGEANRVHEAVATEAALGRGEVTDDGEHVYHVPCSGVDRDLGADLEASDQVLVCDLIDDVTGEHGVSGEEQEVGVDEVPGDVVVGDVTDDGGDGGRGVGTADDPAGDVDLRSGETTAEAPQHGGHAVAVEELHGVEADGPGQAGQIRRFDPVGVDDDDVPDAEPSEELMRSIPTPPAPMMTTFVAASMA